ncbi:MAG TPA: ferrous iron transport protein B [Candidatus Monoglobus merdigallinarum]|uniref:Ferrous iron transport protein B n=1 Tax=Candidatus Monoglobus merdigallinarum TaxID=2838698 RepID=A0A9D1PPP1_9FIRM|nr:ferrous iron transport protein B [Candidatus Monoglobus merdigallinarum]
MSIKIALAGNPNSGKTTLFNALTGSNQFVGNWPGVTVEKKEGKLKGEKDVTVMDLPGIYSLSPYTLEEVIARNYLMGDSPDVILNIVDGSNIERNLYLTTQLIELGIPVVMAVNMMDLVKKNGDSIDFDKMSKELGCSIVPISALKGTGVKEAAKKAVSAAGSVKTRAKVHKFDAGVEKYIERICEKLDGIVPEEQKRFYSIKLFERDDKIGNALPGVPDISQIIKEAEDEFDDDTESIITNERYNYISSVVKSCCRKSKKSSDTTSDKIDRIVTNRWLALPIFAVVMFVVYFVSVTTIGTWATDWANDGLFGDGWHLFGIGSAAYEESLGDWELEQLKAEAFIAAAEEEGLNVDGINEALESDEPDEAAVAAFLESAAGITADAEVESDDGTEALMVSAADFEAAIAAEEPDPADFGVWVPGIPVILGNALETLGTAEWLNSLILDGIVAGVGAVLGFVPQMLVLFIFLAFLESCGYMARIAFIMDRIFRKFGLSGKSFIPMLIGTGCGVPGVMASRTIENERDRRMTIMTTTFIPCSAKLPIIALIAGAIFGGAPWVAPSAYFVGVAAIIVSGIILKKTKMFAGDPAPFVMELPAYHMPTVGNVLRSMWERGWSFIKKAGTIILLSTIVLWFLQGYGFEDGSFGMVEDLNNSLLAAIGGVIAPIFAPLGWGDWRAAVAAVTGLIAKENVVGTFGILYGFAEVAEDGAEIWGTLAADFSAVAGYSFLVFNLLCAPCFAAIGAIKREMNNAKWTWFAIGYQTVFAYVVSLCIYQIGNLLSGGGFSLWFIAALILVALIIYLLVRPYNDSHSLKLGKKMFNAQ